MKILFLGNYDMGLYKFRKELLEELIKRGHTVYVSIPNGEYISKIKELGCKVIFTDIDRRGMNPLAEQKLYKTYCRIIKEVKPDKLLTYTIKPNIYGGLAAKKYRIPQIANVTGLGTAIENGGTKRKLILNLYKRGLSGAQVVFFQNTENKDIFLKEKIITGKYEIIPGSGVDLITHCYEPYPTNMNPLVFLIIGRIMKDKGIDEVIDAAREIKSEYSNILFRFIGFYDEEYQNKIELAEKNGLIEFLGKQDNVHFFIKNSHATIHASYHEGMSNVLQETAAAGRPVLASNIPGCIEIFEPNVSGISFESKNSKDLVRAIKSFIELPYEKKAAMGFAGRLRMEKLFDRNIVINKYLEEIEKEVK